MLTTTQLNKVHTHTRNIMRDMGKKELLGYLDACHRARDYDSYFELACLEYNERYRDSERG